jgi:uncharacterized membrane protein
MSLDTRQSWDWFFWMVIMMCGGLFFLLWQLNRLFIFPLFIIVLVDLWMLFVNNRIAVREMREKERKSPVQEP